MRRRYNLHFFTEAALPSNERKLAECRPKLRTTLARLHVDGVTLHAPKVSIEKIEELGFILVL
jgi:hypothetical protein